MSDVNQNRRDLLIQVAEMYYVKGLSQKEIAKKINVSRSNVSRMLKTCLEKKIVEIRINYTSSMGVYLQDKIKELFGLSNAIVVRTGSSLEETKMNIGKAAAQYLESILQDGMTLGVAWGTTIYHLVQAFRPVKKLHVDIVQLLGGTGARDLNTDGLELARNFARVLKGNCYILQAPLIVQNKVVKDLLLAEPDISQHFERASKVDVAVVGIGSNRPEVSALLRAGYLSKEESEDLLSMGVVGDICGNQIDINGNLCPIDLNERTIGIRLEQLKRIPLVIGLAAGTEKAESILGGLRGKIINSLITDESTALSLINLESIKS